MSQEIKNILNTYSNIDEECQEFINNLKNRITYQIDGEYLDIFDIEIEKSEETKKAFATSEKTCTEIFNIISAWVNKQIKLVKQGEVKIIKVDANYSEGDKSLFYLVLQFRMKYNLPVEELKLPELGEIKEDKDINMISEEDEDEDQPDEKKQKIDL